MQPPTLSSFILASASPRRRDLLAAVGIRCRVEPSEADETAVPGRPEDTVVHIATRKAWMVAAKWPGAYILAADTLVVLDGQTLGKPNSPDEARRMLSKLQGTSHQIMTGVVLVSPGANVTETACEITGVTMRQVSQQAIDRYVHTGEPMDKAGAYAVQGQGREFIDSLDGCYTNAIGLPMCVVCRWLGKHGFVWQRPPDPGCERVPQGCPFRDPI